MLTFLNHACVKVSHKNIRFLMDPYLFGSAFNNGWNLLSEHDHKKELEDINYIWFSHEHPDHFSIDFIKKIPEKKIKTITILFQYTLDKRVIKFCNKLGFKTLELKNGKKYSLDDEFQLICGKVPFYDSWLFLKFGDYKLLNSNDCVFENPEIIKSIKRYVSKVDILLTQFSYANWSGNESEIKIREDLAKEKLSRIKLQCESFDAKFVIPFASFIYFSHEENYFMNKEINNINTVNDYILEHCNSKPIIFKPNENWDCLSIKKNDNALNFWSNEYELLENKKLNSPLKQFNLNQLSQKSADFKNRMYSKNNPTLIRILEAFKILKPVHFYIKDQEIEAVYTWKHSLLAEKKINNYEKIVIHSESLAFLLDFDFGIDTLNVNGRFRCSLNAKRNMIRTFFIPSLNNTGRYLTIFSMLTSLNYNFIINGLKTVGILNKKIYKND